MSSILLLDWDRGSCVIVAAEMGRHGAEFVRGTVWKPEEELSKTTADALGRKLRDFLKANDMPAAPAIVSIGRDRVVLKEIGYPAVPAAEEPGLVRFQATKDLADAVEDVVLDYTVLSEPGAAGERRALAVILRRDIINNLRQVCQTANVKLVGVVPRPFGMAGCVELARRRGLNLPATGAAEQTTAVVFVGERWAEVSVLYGSKLLFSRSLGVGPNLALEIRRSLALYATQPNGSVPRSPPEAIFVAAGPEAPVSLRSLHETLGTPVYELNFLKEQECGAVPGPSRSAVEAGFGLAQAWALKQVPVNLASPKEPPPVVNFDRRRLVLRLALAGTLLIAAWFGGQMVLGRQQRDISDVTRDKQIVIDNFKAQEQDKRDLDAIKDWEKGAVSWIDEIYDLAARFPRDAKFRLTKVHIEPISGRKGNDAFAMRMTLQGLGHHVWVEQFIEKMKDAHIQAKIGPFQGEKFTILVDLVRQPPSAYQAKLPWAGTGPASRYSYVSRYSSENAKTSSDRPPDDRPAGGPPRGYRQGRRRP